MNTKKIYSAILASLLSLATLATPASLSFEHFDIKAGEEKELLIDLNNPDDEITLVQFDLHLPQGISLKQTGGDFDIDMAGRTTYRKHSLDANAIGDAIRFLLSSSSNTAIEGTSGAVIKMTIVANEYFSKGNILLDNILLVTPEEKETKPNAITLNLGGGEAITWLTTEPFTINPNEEATLIVDLNNPNDEFTLVQFDLRLPDGLSVKQINGDFDIDMCDRTTWRRHSLEANSTDGIIRFLLSSSSNTVITGSEGGIIKMTIVADEHYNGGTIVLEKILLVSPDEKEVKPDDVEIMLITGITHIVSNNIDNASIYSLTGQKMSSLKKGINIVGGKKIMIP